MAYHALSELKPGVKNWNVCVHVSHLWDVVTNKHIRLVTGASVT
ncbi:hypothetical protein ACQJBY_019220 [Aegilops geniculata]